MNTNPAQHRVIEYLFGDSSAAQRRQFEEDLRIDEQLQQALELERRLDSVLPPGSQPELTEERLQGNRWLLHQNLQRAARPVFSPWRWLWQRPQTVALQGGALATAFVCGLLLAPTQQTGTGAPELAFAGQNSPSSPAVASPLELINAGDFEIVQLRVNNFDAATGAIDLTFAAASETRVTGNVGDRPINRLLAVALQDEIGSAARLDTLGTLKALDAQGSGLAGYAVDEVYEALIHVLMNDANPGVRYQAVTALAALADRDRVREALREALRDDSNPGVRIKAFNALLQHEDAETLTLFREQLVNDSNDYIRTQSRSILEGTLESEDLVF